MSSGSRSARFRAGGWLVGWLGVAALAFAVASCAAPAAGPAPGGADGPAAAQAKSSAVTTGRGSCPAQCDGSPGSDFEQAVSRRAKDATRCYQSALDADPTLSGRLLVTLTLAETGTTCAVAVTSTTLKVPDGLARCLERHFDVDYPKPTGGCISAVLPLMLRSDADAGT